MGFGGPLDCRGGIGFQCFADFAGFHENSLYTPLGLRVA